MLLRPDLPATRTPPMIGIGVPVSDRPMRRLKNRSVCTGVDGERAAGAHGEQVRVLEEEVALLGIEQAEARQVDLLLVDFDLREVGVDRDVEVEAGGDAVARVEADVADRVGGRASCALVCTIVHAADQERLQLAVPAEAETPTARAARRPG